MFFQRKVDRAMNLQKEQNKEAEREALPTDKDQIGASGKEMLAMILSAWLTFMPIAIVVLLAIAFGAYFILVH